ncbi:MAG: PEGA domain-containing protein, partial [Myxococcales bacterium]|nr:PEGA domain-containing protein [Myxococcales bacterium]
PNTLFNIAQCHEQLFRYDLAVEVYERFLREAPPDDPDRMSVENAMRTLRNLLGTIEIESNAEAEVWLGDRLIGRAPGKVLVPGGRHALELRSEGWIPARKQVDVAGQQTVHVAITLEKAEQTIQQTIEQNYAVTKVERIEDKGISPVFFIAGAAAAVGCAVAGTIFGLDAQSTSDDAKKVDARLPRDSYADDIQKSALAADIFFISAGVLAAGTVVLFFLTDWGGDEEPPASTSTVSIAPVFGPNSAGLSIGGAL